MTNKPRVLYWDLETLPNITYAYDLFSYKSYKMIKQEKSIVSFAWKFDGDRAVQSKTILDFKHKSPYDDKELVKFIISILNQADYVVAHYGDKFDMRFLRARALINNLCAPAPVQTIDTFKLAKRYFYLNANRLDYLGKLLGLGSKLSTSFELWASCAEGDKKAIAKMAKYNRQDVALLQKVFKYMLPHVESKLNHNIFANAEGHVCPHCGSHDLQKRGVMVLKITKRQRWQCQADGCGSWSTTKYMED